MLLEAKADVDLQGGWNGTALQAAACHRHKEILELLLKAKADVNLQGGYHDTALQAAAYFGHKEIVELLLEAKADVHLYGGRYGNALQATIDKEHRQIEELLIGPWLQGFSPGKVAFRRSVRSQYPEALFERVESLDRTLDRVCVHGKWYEVERGEIDELYVERRREVEKRRKAEERRRAEEPRQVLDEESPESDES